MKVRDFITIVEVSDGEQGSSGPSYRNRGTWIYNDNPAFYQWGDNGQKYIDMVGYNGSLFSAKRSGSAQIPPARVPTSNAYWDIVIAKGFIDSDIDWTLTNVEAISKTSLKKTKGSNDTWDATAMSIDHYISNCFISFILTDNKSLLQVGVSTNPNPLYGFYFNKGSYTFIEGGKPDDKTPAIKYAANDKFDVYYDNNVVEFYHNGELVHKSIKVKITSGMGFAAAIASITSYPLITEIKLSTFDPYIDWIREWENGKTAIGEEYIVSPKAFIGVNNGTKDAPELTGVAIGIDIDGSFSSEIGMAGYNINKQTFIIRADGSATFGVDSSNSSQFRIEADGSASIKNLNADNITAGTVKGAYIDAKGLIVRDTKDLESFIISPTGDVDIRGEIKSMNYVNDDKTGYALLRNGKAILNEAIIRGSVILPNAGITNFGESEDNIRIWAGSDYDGRAKANFRVSQNGDLFAKKGTFGGRVAADDVHTGTIHMSNGAFIINNTVTSLNDTGASLLSITPFGTEEEYIHLEKSGSIINTDLLIGNPADRRIEFLKNDRSLVIKDTDIGISGKSIAVTFDRGSSWSKGVSLSSTHANQNAIFSFGYSSSDAWTNTLIISGNGAKSTNTYGDICFRRENSRDNIDVSIFGNLNIRKSISSSEQNIEMRSVQNEGWGFYII